MAFADYLFILLSPNFNGYACQWLAYVNRLRRPTLISGLPIETSAKAQAYTFVIHRIPGPWAVTMTHILRLNAPQGAQHHASVTGAVTPTSLHTLGPTYCICATQGGIECIPTVPSRRPGLTWSLFALFVVQLDKASHQMLN
jgi:hypothetical protein